LMIWIFGFDAGDDRDYPNAEAGTPPTQIATPISFQFPSQGASCPTNCAIF
jgi:hypothetical protein